MTKLFLAAALAAIATPLSAAAAPAAETHSEFPAEVRLNHISVVKFGQGSPVVFIPGLGSPRASWELVAPQVARRHTVYLVQVNGFGGDSPGANLKPGILEGIVADLSSYLAHRKVPPVRLVGHSMGGLASMMFARAHPTQVDRLMIVDALPWFPVLLSRSGTEPTAAQIEPVARMMRDSVVSRYGKPITPEMIKSDVDALAIKPESRLRMAEWATAADPRVTGQLLFEDMSTDMRPALASLAMPITVVMPWTESGFGQERTAEFYRRQFAGAPNIGFVPIAEAGHFVMLDQPAAFANALDSFLEPGPLAPAAGNR